MATVDIRLYFDNQAADEDTLARFGEIRVDQAIGMVTEAELHMYLAVNDEGDWDGMDEDFAQPGARVRIEVKVGDEGEYVPLIDGSVVGNRVELSAEPESSTMILIVQDDSALLNLDETVRLFEDKRADEIATALFEDLDLDVEVDEVPDAGGALPRFTVQRGTAMQLLKELARRHGMFVYVKPGAEAGTSVGVFRYPSWEPGDFPELLLLGEERNVARFSGEFDATRPLAATAYSVGATDKTVIGSTLDTPDVEALGDEPAHDVVVPAQTLLARTREERSDLDEAVFAAVNTSSFAYTASVEVVADSYEGVLAPYQVVTVAGVGGQWSGDYLISRVTHVLSDESYTQQLELKRNARSAAGAAGGIGGII
jgi:phage protein D